MLRNLSQVLFVLSIVMLTGCTTDGVSTTPTNRITMVASGDLSTLSKAYAWHGSMFVVDTANKMDEEALRKQLISSVNKLMANKGYQLVSINDSPQMIVGFGMALESEMSDTEILAKVGLVPGLYTQNINDDYEKGSVLIAFFSPGVKLPFWRVLAQGFTEPARIVEEREARFDALTKMMLNDIPTI
ncbi:DUF4136 domain-containing protein [Shewanella sp. A14]